MMLYNHGVKESITKKQVEGELERFFGENKERSRESQKWLLNNHYKFNKLVQEVICERVIDEMKSPNHDPGKIQKLIKCCSWTKRFEANHAKFVEFITKNLESPDGMTRELSRRNVDYLIMGRAKVYDPGMMLRKIETMIAKRKSELTLVSLEESPPSIYKTLGLVWYDVADRVYRDNFEEMMIRAEKLGLPDRYKPDLMLEDEIEKWTLTDWVNGLHEYCNYVNEDSANGIILELEGRYRKLLQNACDMFSCRVFFDRIDDCIRLRNFDRINEVMKYAAEDKDLEKADTLMMAVQLYLDNMALDSGRGRLFSRGILSVLSFSISQMQEEYVDLLSLLVRLRETWMVSDEINHEIVEKSVAEIEEIHKKYQMKSETDFRLMGFRANLIANYMIHLLFSSDYPALQRKTAVKNAANIWGALGIFNPQLSQLGIDNGSLAKIAGYTNASGISGAKTSMSYDLLNAAGRDDSFFLIDAYEAFARRARMVREAMSRKG